MIWIFILLLLAGGALGCAPLIIAKKPDARQIIDKLVPFQAVIGVVLAAVSVIVLVKLGVPALRLVSLYPVMAIALLAGSLGGVLLGVVFGMPMISKATGRNGDEVVAKLAPYQLLLGVVCAAAGGLLLLETTGILRYI